MPDHAPAPPPAPTARAFAGAVVALLCLASAALQLNDPDWVPWVAYYLAAAVAATLASVTRARPREDLALLAAVVGLAWAGTIAAQGLEPVSWAELTGDLGMKTVHVERAREVGGLTLVGAALLGLGLSRRRIRRSGAPQRPSSSASTATPRATSSGSADVKQTRTQVP